MNPVPNTYTIVVLGAWNPSIFTPEWMTKNLFEDNQEIDIQVAFPIDDPTAPRKITADNIIIFPGRKQLILGSLNSDIEDMKTCSKLLVKILELLTHTPVSSAGINFSFFENSTTQELENVMLPSDNGNLLEKYTIKETQIQRVLQSAENDNILNFIIKTNDDGYILSYNFHYDFKSIEKYQELFSGNVIENHYNEAIELADNCYGITLTENREDEENETDR